MKALVWPVATYGCESWTLRKNEETRIDVFNMKGLRKILRVSWTAKKTNEWVLNKAGVKRELLDTVKARKLAHWSHREETRKLPRKRDNARNNARCTQARKTTHGLRGQHLNTWTLAVEKSIKMTQDRDKWRKYAHGVVNARIEDGKRTEQNMSASATKQSYTQKLTLCSVNVYHDNS